MEIDMSFPGLSGVKNPDVEQISSLFLKTFPDAWTEDADVTCIMEDGSFKRLSIVANPKYGIWLWHRQSDSDGKDTNHISLGDPEKLETYVDALV